MSVQERVRVTEVEFVDEAPLLMEIEPVGGVVSLTVVRVGTNKATYHQYCYLSIWFGLNRQSS